MTPDNISQTHLGLVKKDFSCQELVESYLKTIKKEDGKIHAFLEVFEKEAIEKAKEVDKKIAAKKKINLLEGIPMAIKDNLLYEGHRASAASKILENYVSPYTATAVKKIEEAGAIILGRTNMDEFAMGSSTENSAFGPTKNPHDLKRVPGGSSGGPAAAVAAKMCVFSLGTDTGGSIRQPAAFCGVAGLKPTYGAVSRYGLIAMASSLDVIGPIAANTQDLRIVFEAIRGFDAKDATTSRTKNLSAQGGKTKNLKIGVPKEYFIKGLNKEIKNKTEEAIEWFKKQGAKIKEVSLPHTQYALPAYYLIMPSEVSSNLARYDGIRYSKILNQSASWRTKIKNLDDVYFETRSAGLGDEVKRRIMLGTFALSAGYYDAYYKKAKAVQERIKREFLSIFKEVDCLITPTTPTTAFKLGEKTADPLQMYLADIFTVSANLAGLPALSIPNGQINGLPVGLQIIGRPFEEEVILGLGEGYDKNVIASD